MKIAYVDGRGLRRSLLAANRYVRTRRAELNRINVFPVPDGDTGSNLALTVQAISDRLEAVNSRDVGSVAYAAAEAAVLGARGNCGMMLSQVLLEFAEHLKGQARASATELAAALRAGADRLESALERPVEGTILTVVRETARAGVNVDTPDVSTLISELVTEAPRSLDRTPDLLPVLRIELLEKAIPSDVENVRFGVVHVACPETVEEVSSALAEKWERAEILTSPATPVIANHVGIGAWGVAFPVED